MASCSVSEDEQLPVIWVKEITCKNSLFAPLFCFFSFPLFSLPPPFRLRGSEDYTVMQASKGTAVPCVQTTRGTRNCKGSRVGRDAFAVSQEDGISSRLVRADAVSPISSFLLSHAGGFTLPSAALISPHGSTMPK